MKIQFVDMKARFEHEGNDYYVTFDTFNNNIINTRLSRCGGKCLELTQKQRKNIKALAYCEAIKYLNET